MEEFGSENAAKFEYSLTQHVKDLDQVAEMARKAGDYRTLLKSRELKGKVCGHYTEKHEVSGQVGIAFLWEGEDEK